MICLMNEYELRCTCTLCSSLHQNNYNNLPVIARNLLKRTWVWRRRPWIVTFVNQIGRCPPPKACFILSRVCSDSDIFICTLTWRRVRETSQLLEKKKKEKEKRAWSLNVSSLFIVVLFMKVCLDGIEIKFDIPV